MGAKPKYGLKTIIVEALWFCLGLLTLLCSASRYFVFQNQMKNDGVTAPNAERKNVCDA